MKIHGNSKVTVNDVASHAGVSVGTVSRVLNGYQNISAENLDRVQKAIAELGYQRNGTAGLLAARRGGARIQTGNIGLIYAEMAEGWANHPLVAAYSMGVERACQEKGFHALIEFCGGGDHLPRCVSEKKIDGLLLKATRGLPAFAQRLTGDLPMVCMGTNDPAIKIQQVAPDNYGAGWVATDYLWKLGHRRIAFVSTEETHPIFLSRFQGYEGFMRSQRMFDPSLCYLRQTIDKGRTPEPEPPNMDATVEAITATAGGLPTAILAANDWIAHGLYTSLERKGFRIPDDFSIISFDNVNIVCSSLRPQLTSFSIPFEEVAYAATLKVIECLYNPSQLWEHSLHLIRGELIERASVRTIA
jgi:LacI family transcriptional regulator